MGDHRILSTCVILALEAKRLLHKGCKAYLAHVVDTSTPKLTLRRVSMVQEFSDVFPMNLPRLLLDQKLEFGIELLPELTLISIPSYRTALAKLNELKT